MTETTARVVVAQLNPLVGDIAGNTQQIIAVAGDARERLKADIVVFPELAVTGYPPEDLLLRPRFIRLVETALERLREETRGVTVIVGYPAATPKGLHNAAAVLANGELVATYFKQLLPNYSVFDEKRYFTAGSTLCVVELQRMRVGITICEDIWQAGPMRATAAAGAQVVINLNASPYHTRKEQEREEVLRQRVAENHIPVIYVNQVGGQDELVFDGGSMVMDASGRLTQRGPFFSEALIPVDLCLGDGRAIPMEGEISPLLSLEQSVYRALVLGVRDYVRKNGFKGVVLGLSGGIDSALTLAIAVDALGSEQVEAVLMPSRYTADISISDAVKEAQALSVHYRILPLEPAFQAFLDILKPVLEGLPPDVTEENIQARCRGILLMAISNKTGRLLLTTANKSETAVGYSTLYGDMAGGFAPIKDVAKTLVYRLAAYRNSLSPVIPERVIARAPSAELRLNPKDEDSLPPYDVLDPILFLYVEQDRSVEEIVAAGYPKETVEWVARLVIRNEYKRRQAPPGVRITPRAFGRDRRYPISSGFRQ
jgi:NAD+ synthase (glutamine-hydrolysing)